MVPSPTLEVLMPTSGTIISPKTEIPTPVVSSLFTFELYNSTRPSSLSARKNLLPSACFSIVNSSGFVRYEICIPAASPSFNNILWGPAPTISKLADPANFTLEWNVESPITSNVFPIVTSFLTPKVWPIDT